MRKTIAILALATSLLFLVGCGNKGPLVLPETTEQSVL